MKQARLLVVLCMVVLSLAAFAPLAYAAPAGSVAVQVAPVVAHMYLNGTYQTYTFPTTIAGLMGDASTAGGDVMPISFMVVVIGALVSIVVLFYLWRHAKGRGAS